STRPERPVPQATSRQTAPPPGPRHSRNQDSAASVWKAEKVSSYHSAWPSYRAIPGPTLSRLAGIPLASRRQLRPADGDRRRMTGTKHLRYTYLTGYAGKI